MRAITLAVLTCGAAALGACGTSGSNELSRTDPVRALLSADALMYGDFDANHDFQVTMEEVEAGITAEFTRADSNSDGSIGPIEFQSWSNQVLGGGMTPPYRLDFDRNVDNIISQEEFRNEILARAREYDNDENGAITRAEFIRNLNQARPAHRAPPSDVDAPNGQRPPR